LCLCCQNRKITTSLLASAEFCMCTLISSPFVFPPLSLQPAVSFACQNIGLLFPLLLPVFPLGLDPNSSSSCCEQEDPTYFAIWGDNKAFNEVIISPAMLHEHLPYVVMEGLNKVTWR